MFISPCSHHLLVTASIFHAFIIPRIHLRELPRCKRDNWFLSVTLHWIYNYRCQTKAFLDAKTLSCGNNYTSLFLKHSFFLRVVGWRVIMFSYLYFICWQSCILIELDGVRKKSLLGVLVFRHPYCSRSNSTEFNAEQENACPFSFQISIFLLTYFNI